MEIYIQKKTVYIILAVLAIAATGAIIVFNGNKSSTTNDSNEPINNVTIVNGKQVITINAKGGYYPRVTTAKADMTTIIKMNTQNTFDCSSSLTIPMLGYRTNLEPSGETTIDVLPQKAGTSLRGLCGMGMYSFTINFTDA